MSAERLAVWDLMRCSRCHKWHPAETWASGSATDYADKMLFIRCDTAHFFVGTIDGRATDPKAVKSLVELEFDVVETNSCLKSVARSAFFDIDIARKVSPTPTCLEPFPEVVVKGPGPEACRCPYPFLETSFRKASPCDASSCKSSSWAYFLSGCSPSRLRIPPLRLRLSNRTKRTLSARRYSHSVLETRTPRMAAGSARPIRRSSPTCALPIGWDQVTCLTSRDGSTTSDSTSRHGRTESRPRTRCVR